LSLYFAYDIRRIRCGLNRDKDVIKNNYMIPVSVPVPVLYAGRRTDFRDKKSSDFSGEIFRERNYCPRTAFSGSNSFSILSNHVIS